MARIVWRDQLNIGFTLIDDDHKMLVEYLNDLDAAVNGRAYDSKTVAQIVLKMLQYAQEHIEREDDLMVRSNYPETEGHKRAHAELTAQANKIGAEFLRDQSLEKAIEIYEFVADWLVKHIIDTDQKLGDYLNKSNFTLSSDIFFRSIA